MIPTNILEVATSNYISTAAAVKGGADRIELCSNLGEGGTTPSYGHLRQCREAFSLPIFPIIRPRGGDFLYSDEEFLLMQKDIMLCKELGFDGIVIGLLTSDGQIDIGRTAKLVALAWPLSITFHRAFDRCADPLIALEQIIELGCERILTSGQQPNAVAGIEMIAELNRIANNRIIIMPGSGVRKENVDQLAARTGCTEFHSSLRSPAVSKMTYRHGAFANDNESYDHSTIASNDVAEMKAAIEKLPDSSSTFTD